MLPFLGLSTGYGLLIETPLRSVGFIAKAGDNGAYLPILLFGADFLVCYFDYLKVHVGRLLLRPHRTLTLLVKGTLFWRGTFLKFIAGTEA